MIKTILVTGATGKQGGSVIDAILALPKEQDEYCIIAVTRDTNSSAAKSLGSRCPTVKLLAGNLDDVPAIFDAAHSLSNLPIWGVYSVQISMGKGVTKDSEIAQGEALIDASLKHGVKHFVYSSVERGGDETSWDEPTPIPHFQSKYAIERYLRVQASQSNMGWTILRPVGFMDNIQPGFASKVFLTALRDTVKEKPTQWIASKDIGFFAALAFSQPAVWDQRAIGLAGDSITFSQLERALKSLPGSPVATTYSVFGNALMWMVHEVNIMVNWFATDGYKADIGALRSIHPGLLSFEEWLRTESGFAAQISI